MRRATFAKSAAYVTKAMTCGHFALLAERSIMLRRLRERGLGRAVDVIAGQRAALRVERFAVSRLDLCLERLQEPEFAEQVWTDHLTIAQVADHIADATGCR